MKVAFPTIFHLIFTVSPFVNNGIAQKPPQLQPNLEKQKIVKPDDPVALPCPVYGDKREMMFAWYKDKELVVALGGDRHRVTGNGTLRIKGVNADDTGVYTCRAVNGFGIVEYNITLVVIDDNEEYEDVSFEVETKVSEDLSSKTNEDVSTPKIGSGSVPFLLYVTEWNKTQHHRLPGSSVTFHCVAMGDPKPKVTWLRNSRKELPSIAKKGRWSLQLNNLRERDSGNYTCIASNMVGTTSHSFTVDVSILSESSRAKPVLTGDHPSNTTVEEGQMAMFQCMMRSVVRPHIEWLKRVEEHEMNGDEFRDVIKMENENFRVIKSSDAMGKSDGSFFNKLVIPDTRVSDSGKYICFGANTNGYSYRSAYLHVLPKSPMIDETDVFPFPIVVTVIVLSLATIAGVVAILIYCRNRKRSRNRSYEYSTEMPMVTNEVFMLVQQQQQRYPSGTRTYEPTSRNSGQQVSVYVPNGIKNNGSNHSQTPFVK